MGETGGLIQTKILEKKEEQNNSNFYKEKFGEMYLKGGVLILNSKIQQKTKEAEELNNFLANFIGNSQNPFLKLNSSTNQ